MPRTAELIQAFLWTCNDLFHPPEVANDPSVQEAAAFKEHAEAVPGADYGWVYDYARDSYDRVADTRDTLDAKAGEIIKYLGGGAGFITLAALLNVSPQKTYVLLWATPSFILTVVSLGFAVLARKPNEAILPPTIESTKRYADHFKSEEEAKAAFIGQWHFAYTAMKVVNRRMADRVHFSICCFFWAIVGLAAPLLAAYQGG